MASVKFFFFFCGQTHKRTNAHTAKRTNRQTEKETGQKVYAPDLSTPGTGGGGV